jgi:hypothetical protein
MSGKGDKRRPMQISQEEFSDNWDRIFGNKTEKSDTSTRLAEPWMLELGSEVDVYHGQEAEDDLTEMLIDEINRSRND